MQDCGMQSDENGDSRLVLLYFSLKPPLTEGHKKIMRSNMHVKKIDVLGKVGEEQVLSVLCRHDKIPRDGWFRKNGYHHEKLSEEEMHERLNAQAKPPGHGTRDKKHFRSNAQRQGGMGGAASKSPRNDPPSPLDVEEDEVLPDVQPAEEHVQEPSNFVKLVRACSYKEINNPLLKRLFNQARQSLTESAESFSLHQHQILGAMFIIWQEWESGHGGILADECGLGKTLTFLTAICISIVADQDKEAQEVHGTYNTEKDPAAASSTRLRTKNAMKPDAPSVSATLVVVPRILLEQWQDQIKKHLKEGVLKSFHFQANDADDCKDSEKLRTKLKGFHVVFVVLEELSAYNPSNPNGSKGEVWRKLLGIQFHRCVVDEGHQLSKVSNRFQFLLNVQVKKNFRWIMTGTPVDETKGGANNAKRMCDQITALQLNDTLTVGKRGSVVSLLNSKLQHEDGVELLSQFVRCQTKKEVMPSTELKISEFPVKCVSTQYNAFQEKITRDVALARERKEGIDRDGPSSDLVGKNSAAAAKKATRLAKLAFCEENPAKKYFVPATEQTRRLLRTDEHSENSDADKGLQKKLKNILDELEKGSGEPMQGRCELCKEEMFKGFVTSECTRLVCPYCVLWATHLSINKISCCSNGCSIQDTLLSNIKTQDVPVDEASVLPVFDKKRSNSIMRMTAEKVKMGKKVVIYTEHPDFMRHLQKTIEENLPVGKDAGQPSGSGASAARQVVIASIKGTTGGTAAKRMEQVALNIRSFQTDLRVKVAIIGEDGVAGLDFSQGSVLILAHPPWPDVNLDQLYSRCYRIGQKQKTVEVIRVFSPETVEDSLREIRQLEEEEDAGHSSLAPESKRMYATRILRAAVMKPSEHRYKMHQQRAAKRQRTDVGPLPGGGDNFESGASSSRASGSQPEVGAEVCRADANPQLPPASHGGGARPLKDWSSDELSSFLHSQGPTFGQAAAEIIRCGFTGAALEDLLKLPIDDPQKKLLLQDELGLAPIQVFGLKSALGIDVKQG